MRGVFSILSKYGRCCALEQPTITPHLEHVEHVMRLSLSQDGLDAHMKQLRLPTHHISQVHRPDHRLEGVGLFFSFFRKASGTLNAKNSRYKWNFSDKAI